MLTTSSATFVQPRYAKLLNAKQLREAMGDVPKKEPIPLADRESESHLNSIRDPGEVHSHLLIMCVCTCSLLILYV